MKADALSNIFNETVDIISIINNIVQFLAFLLAVFAVFFILSRKYLRPIKTLLYPIGLKHRKLLKILYLCRKNPRLYIRVFCEYMILKSGGEHKSTQWWNRSLQDFTAYFKDSLPDNFVYDVDNCTNLLSESISTSINEYLDYFSETRVRKKYDLSLPVCFCTKIQIKEGFLSTNFLLTGLLDRYKNNWANLVKKYISATIQNRDTMCGYASEIYFTFAWLLWGPSYQIKNQDGDYKLCQFAFGDECNSLHIALNNDQHLLTLWKELLQTNGILMSLTCRLYKAKQYIDKYKSFFNPANSYFLRKISEQSTGILLEPLDYLINHGYKSKNYYCTAYVWIMFETVEEGANFFNPTNTVTFFEHANLSNQSNYDFCIQSLITKSFAHFDAVFSSSSDKGYRYCLSMNDVIETAFYKRYHTYIQNNSEHSDKYKERISIIKKYSEQDIFSSFDSYFSNNNGNLEYVEVSSDNKESLILLGQFYTGVFIHAFSDPNQRETFDSILDFLNKKASGWYKNNNYHILLAIINKEVVAGLICDYFYESNSACIEYIAVDEKHQNDNIGTKLYHKAVTLLRSDSLASGHSGISHIFCEIEESSDIACSKSHMFWNKLGFRKVDFRYIQPALNPQKECVTDLSLLSLPYCLTEENSNVLSEMMLESYLIDFAHFAIRIENPYEHQTIKMMLNELYCRKGENINLIPIMVMDNSQINNTQNIQNGFEPIPG